MKKHIFFLLLTPFFFSLPSPALLSAADKAQNSKQEQSQTPPPAESTSPATPSTGTATGEKTFSSVEERRLYNTLEQERSGLQEKIKVLADKEKELKTLEQEVDKKFEQLEVKIQELKKVQQKTDELLAQKTQEELKKIKELSTIYAKMAPEKAALALSSLEDQQLAADLLANMKAKSAAKILEQLDKLKASRLTQSLSTLSPE